MTNGNDRLDRIERILERVAAAQVEFANELKGLAHTVNEIAKRQDEMTARQQYHDEAFERHDTEMKAIREAIAADAENIRALARIAELHHRRLERLEGEEPA